MSKLLVNGALRIWHPSVSAEEVVRVIGLPARFSRTVGDSRPVSAGIDAPPYEQTYLVMPLARKIVVELGDQILAWCSELEPNAEFLRSIVATGGKAEINISVFVDGLGGFELDHDALKTMHAMGLGVAIELYPPEEVGGVG